MLFSNEWRERIDSAFSSEELRQNVLSYLESKGWCVLDEYRSKAYEVELSTRYDRDYFPILKSVHSDEVLCVAARASTEHGSGTLVLIEDGESSGREVIVEWNSAREWLEEVISNMKEDE